MDSLTQKPTIVVVPGSFSPPYFYNTFVSQLTAHKYDVIVADLPSVGGKTAATMADDAQAIKAVISKVVDEGKDIVLIMHSYGGVPGTESAHGVTKSGKCRARKEVVVALLYVTAFLVGPGKSLGSRVGEGAGVPDYVKVEGDFMTLEAEGNSKATFSNLAVSEAVACAGKMPYHSTLTFGGELNHSTYLDISSFYLIAENDKVIRPEMQRSMMDAANELRGSPITGYAIPTGHFPFISQPGMVVEVVRKVAGEKL